MTYQQAHKYEKGINRIAAGRLYTMAQALGVEVGFFYDGINAEPGAFAPTAKQRRAGSPVQLGPCARRLRGFKMTCNPRGTCRGRECRRGDHRLLTIKGCPLRPQARQGLLHRQTPVSQHSGGKRAQSRRGGVAAVARAGGLGADDHLVQLSPRLRTPATPRCIPAFPPLLSVQQEGLPSIRRGTRRWQDSPTDGAAAGGQGGLNAPMPVEQNVLRSRSTMSCMAWRLVELVVVLLRRAGSLFDVT